MSDKAVLVIVAVVAYMLWRHSEMSNASTKSAAGVGSTTNFTPVTRLRAGNMQFGGPTKPVYSGY